jgi:heme-degrading monooxygenase HmoA
MFVSISVHRLKPGKEQLMIDSMRRYGAAAKEAGGLERVHELKDEKTGDLVGLAIWDSKEAYEAAEPALMRAVEGDDFADWHEGPWAVYHCLEA